MDHVKRLLLLLCLASVADAQTYKYYEKTTIPPGGHVVNIKDFGTSVGSGSDDTTAFSSAVTKALASGPATIYLPCGNYILTSAVTITLAVSTTQGVYIKGENAGCVKITQTGDANGFTVQVNNFGPSLFGSGAVGFSGLTLAMTGASTARTGISITTSASSGAQGIPTIIDQVNFTSVDASHYWGTEISLNEVTGFYVSRVNGTYPAAAVGTHLSINGNSTSYSADGHINDLYFINGTGIAFGNYLQGMMVTKVNIHSPAAGYAIYAAPSAGVNLAYQITDSYLLGRTYFKASGSGSLGSLKFSNDYFDALGTVIPTNGVLVDLNNILVLSMNNNTYACTNGSSGITGLSLIGTLVTTTINDEQINDCPVGVAVNATTYPIKFSHVQFRPNNASYVNISDTGTIRNVYSGDMSMGSNLGVDQYQLPAWTTNGVLMGGRANTITDMTTTGTIAEEAFATFPAETLTLPAGHTATVTAVDTLYVPLPACSNAGGGTLTCTNLFSIDAEGTIRSLGGGGIQSIAGAVLQGAGVSLNAASNNNVNINTTGSTGTTTVGNSSSTFSFLAGTVTGTGWMLLPQISSVGTAAADQPTAGNVGEVVSLHCVVGAAAGAASNVSTPVASPGVVTWASHTFTSSTSLANYTCPINFLTAGSLPTGIVPGTTYYIIGSTVSGDTFQVADTAAHALAGTNAINFTGSTSGQSSAFLGAVGANGTAVTGAAVRLVAGDWDCSGLSEFQELTAITATRWAASIDTSIVLTIGNFQDIRTASGAIGAASYALAPPIVRENISATTSVFLVDVSAFSVGTMNQGGRLSCRRMR